MRRQKDVGIDVPGDGEFGKSMGNRVNYGAWWSYAFQRLGGLEFGGPGLGRTPRRSRPGEIVLTKPGTIDATASALPQPTRDPESGVFDGAATDDGSGLRW